MPDVGKPVRQVDLNQLVKICRKHTLAPASSVIIPEPYVPFVPTNWNGVLVTAEAQNLSNTNATYRSWLLNQGTRKRILRLREYGTIGIAPWTDGTMPLAVQAALNVKPEETAVSNAVPWSLVSESECNLNPTSELVTLASRFWEAMLAVLRPKVLLVCGKIGRVVFSPKVLESTPSTQLHLASSASAQLLSRVSGMFCQTDLLQRYPEVAKAAKLHPAFLKKHRRNKIFFACHVVSVVKGKSQSTGPSRTLKSRSIVS